LIIRKAPHLLSIWLTALLERRKGDLVEVVAAVTGWEIVTERWFNSGWIFISQSADLVKVERLIFIPVRQFAIGHFWAFLIFNSFLKEIFIRWIEADLNRLEVIQEFMAIMRPDSNFDAIMLAATVKVNCLSWSEKHLNPFPNFTPVPAPKIVKTTNSEAITAITIAIALDFAEPLTFAQVVAWPWLDLNSLLIDMDLCYLVTASSTASNGKELVGFREMHFNYLRLIDSTMVEYLLALVKVSLEVKNQVSCLIGFLKTINSELEFGCR
jgi:hypothetical protein